MGLIKKAATLGVGYAVVHKAIGAVEKHDESKMKIQQENQRNHEQIQYSQYRANSPQPWQIQQQESQRNYEQLPAIQDRSSSPQQWQNYDNQKHASYCHGTCNGQCLRGGQQYEGQRNAPPTYHPTKS